MRSLRLLVFSSAFACLVFELIISRLADFHLGYFNTYLALPITFFGLTLGSLHVHFRAGVIDRFQVTRALVSLALVCAATLLLIYVMFAQYTIFAVTDTRTWFSTLPIKTLAFTLVFIIPFYVFGRILTVCYHLGRGNRQDLQRGLLWSGPRLFSYAAAVPFHQSARSHYAALGRHLPDAVGVFSPILGPHAGARGGHRGPSRRVLCMCEPPRKEHEV